MGVVLGPCFIMQYFCSFLFCCHLAGEERAGCFALVVFLVSSRCIVLWPRGVATYTQKGIFVHIWTQNMGIFYHNSDGFLM